MTWQPEVDELRRREELARRMGGPEKVERQHRAGRLTVRERIDQLLDPESFHEIGALSGVAEYGPDGELLSVTPSNTLLGRGRIDGRPVAIEADDFTVRGGAADAAIHDKQVAAEQLAREYRMPLIRLVEGTGGGGSVKTLAESGYTYLPFLPGWDHVVANLSTVPVVALGLGPVAGLGAARMVASHYSVMIEGQSQLFVAGPPVVEAAGERLSKEELGGSRIHTRNGAVDDEVGSEAEAFAACRRFLSYLPSSVHELPPRVEPEDDPGRREEWLIDAVPRDRRRVYKMRPILEALIDRDSLFEIGRYQGPSIITALGRLDGWPVAIVASEPFALGGLWTAAASDKLLRFVDLAETFHLPVVHLVDNPGFLVGSRAEAEGTIRHGVRALAAIYQATVPWCTVVIRKAFGVAGAGHGNHTRYRYRFAWPSADWGSLPLEGGIQAAYKAELEASPDPEARVAEIMAELDRIRSPFRTAERFLVEEIIDPRDTRRMLTEFANLAAPLRQVGPPSFGTRP
ncbi:MAG: carboxyl transferase domain-containing protein [Gemmatimonadales bacterium]